MKSVNLDLNNWKDYKNVWTHSLWIIDKRNNKYGDCKFHGNFIHEIPYQMMMRYTKTEDWVLDPAAGSGTTGDVAKELGRNCDMYDLNPIRKDIKEGDTLTSHYPREYDLIIFHPPYSNIISYSNKENDLSSVKDYKEYLDKFKKAVLNLNRYLKSGHYFILVCGEVWERGEEIPLGFYCSEIIREIGYIRKGVIVKNYGDTEGGKVYNRKNKALQRYRHLKNGTWEFSFDMIWVMKKK